MIALLGTISAVVTSTTVTVALPDIMGAFGIGQDRAQWITTGNLAGQTVGQLLSAWLIASFGQRKTFVVGLCIFVVSLLVAALSPNDLVLVAARVVQGLLAGVLQSLSMFTLFSVFPPEKRGMAMGFFSINTIFGPAVGPTVGGLLIEHFDWRSIFYMGLPFSVIGILFGSLLMPEREETARRADFDWLGFALLCTTMSCLLTGLSNGQREGWGSDFILGSLAVAAGAGIAFLVWELRVPHAAGQSSRAGGRPVCCGGLRGGCFRNRAVRHAVPHSVVRADDPGIDAARCRTTAHAGCPASGHIHAAGRIPV